jgi:rod shape-determining protein MreC
LKKEGSTALHGLASVAVGFLLMVFLSGNPAAYLVMDTAGTVLLWPELPARAARIGVEKAVSWFGDTTRLQREIDKLQAENVRLKQALHTAVSESVSSSEEGLLRARVVLRRPDDWWKELKIDKGSADGIEKGMAVLQDGFLVGRVFQVSRNFSWVELLTSPVLMIPAVVEETRDLGVIAGDGEGRISLLYVPLENLLTPGMKLTSALVSEHLAPGLRIGEVGEATGISGGYRIYSVVPGAEFSRLYNLQVFVKKEGPR